MKVLITGGAGFFGLHMAHRVAKSGHQAVLLDVADYETGEYPAGTTFHKGDVRDPAAVERALDGVDLVVHGAAALPLWTPDDIYETNVFGTRTVLDRVHAAGRVTRTVFISSTAVYGVPRVHPLLEYFPLVGVGPYGESKILAEMVCDEFREKGLVVTTIRPKTFIGRYRLGVFQILYDWVQAGKRIPVIGNGRNRYQLLEVEDLVDAVTLALETPDAAAANDVYNVGARQFGTVLEDVGALCAHAGSGARVLTTPAGPIIGLLKVLEKAKLSPLYEWVYGTAHKDSFVSIDRIRERLGWEPRFSNAEALIHSYDWYMGNQDTVAKEAGVTHRVAWDQGALKIARRLL
jgi:nucleoside-diphosphate-sugar epimerase